MSLRIVLVGIAAGVVFMVLDGLLNANPLAQRLYAVYRPMARESANVSLGVGFDLLAGIVMAALFVLMQPSLPGGAIVRGLVFGLIVWFFRTAMGVAGQAVMFKVPGATLAYALAAGALEMCILGLIFGIALRRPA